MLVCKCYTLTLKIVTTANLSLLVSILSVSMLAHGNLSIKHHFLGLVELSLEYIKFQKQQMTI